MKKSTINKLFKTILIIVICFSFFTACRENETEKKYKQAFDLIESGDYVSAYNLFVELGDYKNSENEILKFHYGVSTSTITNKFNDEEDTTTYKVTYNNDNLPLKTEEMSGNEIVHTCNYQYNDNHKVIIQRCVLADGSEERNQYDYDSDNNMIKWTTTSQSGTDVFEYEYNENGKIIKIDYLYADGTKEYATYTYDDKGQNIRSSFIDSSGENIYEITYDENSNAIKVIYKLGLELVKTTDYVYDKNNNVITMTETSKNNTTTTNYTYDSSNNLIKEEVSNTTGLYYEHTYQYNELGQNIKETQIFSQGLVTEIERTYKLVYVPYEMSDDAWNELIYADLGLVF